MRRPGQEAGSGRATARPPRRRRGSGSVYWDAERGLWRGKAAIGKDPATGRRRVRTVSDADEDACRHKLRALIEEVERGDRPRDRRRVPSVREYLEKWQAEHRHKVRPSTAVNYAQQIRDYIVPALGAISLDRLRRRDIERMLAAVRDRPRSPATVNRVLALIHSALQDTVGGDGWLASNPADGIGRDREERDLPGGMTDEQAAAAIDAVAGIPWLHPFVRVLVGSAMRSGEAIGLDWRDVDERRGTAMVRVSKTRQRAVPLSRDAVAALALLRASLPERDAAPDTPVFRGPRSGRRLTHGSAYHAFWRATASRDPATGRLVGGLNLHALRHGAVTRMLEKGVNIVAVAGQAGHSRPSTTSDMYGHVTPLVAREATAALDVRRAAPPARGKRRKALVAGATIGTRLTPETRRPARGSRAPRDLGTRAG